MRSWAAVVGGAGLVVAIGVGFAASPASSARARTRQSDAVAQQSPARRLELRDEGYVGSGACARCHEANHASWHASFHRTMTQEPSSAGVLAPFEGVTPVLEGRGWRLERAGEDFFVTPIAPDGSVIGERSRVALLTGSHHYQIYWLATASGALEQLPLVWHVAEAQWVPRKAMFLQPPGPTGPETDRWQAVCIKCHSTNGTPSHPAADGATRVAELGIACEACHGPGAAHVAWAERAEARDDDTRDARDGDANDEEHGAGDGDSQADPGTDPSALAAWLDAQITNPSALDPVRSTQVCGQCHGIHIFGEPAERDRWVTDGFEFRPGQDLAASRRLVRGRLEDNDPAVRAFLEQNPETLDELFWADGQVRVSGREYNGLVESPCFQRGEGERRMSCVSCHELHASPARVAAGWASDQLRAGMDGPRACTQCHAQFDAPEALAAHTRHALSSTGSDCLNCHMPYTTYGLTKAIRSHTITSPSAAAALETGRPDACNQCHLDRSLAWTSEWLAKWYGHEPVELEGERADVAASVLWALTGDAGQRALAAWSLGWEPARAASGTGWMPPLLSTLLMDEYDAVRWIAQRTLRLEPRWREFGLDFCSPLEAQQEHVRGTVLYAWQHEGLTATPAQREAVLVQPDGTLDRDRFLDLYRRRNQRPVRLSE